MRRGNRKCYQVGEVFKELQGHLADGAVLTEFELQEENGVVSMLDDMRHYTYSIFPSSRAVKTPIEMKFYEKPIYNYRLECETSQEGKTMKDFMDTFKINGNNQAFAMLETYRTMAISAICIIFLLPLASGKATFICTPIAFIVVAGLLVKPLILTLDTSEWLSNYAETLNLPEWTNDCIDKNVNIELNTLEAKKDDILFLSNQMFILGVLMSIYCCMVALCMLGLACITVLFILDTIHA